MKRILAGIGLIGLALVVFAGSGGNRYTGTFVGDGSQLSGIQTTNLAQTNLAAINNTVTVNTQANVTTVNTRLKAVSSSSGITDNVAVVSQLVGVQTNVLSTNEIWIASSNSYASCRTGTINGSGTILDPFSGDFDAIMSRYQGHRVTINVLPGTNWSVGYRTSSDWQIQTGWTLKGSGLGNSVIKFRDFSDENYVSNNLPVDKLPYSKVILNVADNAYDWSVSSLTLDCGPSTSHVYYNIPTAGGIRGGGSNIGYYPVSTNGITGIVTWNFTGPRAAVAMPTTVRNWSIRQCKTVNNYGLIADEFEAFAFGVNGTGGLLDEWSVSGSQGDYVNAVQLGGNGVVVQNGRAEMNGLVGINTTSATNCVVQNNWIDAYTGIYGDTGSAVGMIATGNTFTNVARSFLFQLSEGQNFVIDGFTFRNNHIAWIRTGLDWVTGGQLTCRDANGSGGYRNIVFENNDISFADKGVSVNPSDSIISISAYDIVNSGHAPTNPPYPFPLTTNVSGVSIRGNIVCFTNLDVKPTIGNVSIGGFNRDFNGNSLDQAISAQFTGTPASEFSASARVTSMTVGAVVGTGFRIDSNGMTMKSYAAGSLATNYPNASYYSLHSITGHAYYGFLEDSYVTYNSGIPIIGHASFDDNIHFIGSVSSDHHNSYQAYPHLSGSQNITNLHNFYGILDHTGSGTVWNYSGGFIDDPTGGGAINTFYGYYVNGHTNLATNTYAFFSKYEAPSVFGGNVVAGANCPNPRGLIVGDPTLGAKLMYNGNGNLDITPRSGYDTTFTAGRVGVNFTPVSGSVTFQTYNRGTSQDGIGVYGTDPALLLSADSANANGARIWYGSSSGNLILQPRSGYNLILTNGWFGIGDAPDTSLLVKNNGLNIAGDYWTTAHFVNGSAVYGVRVGYNASSHAGIIAPTEGNNLEVWMYNGVSFAPRVTATPAGTLSAVTMSSTNGIVLPCPDGGSWIVTVNNDGTFHSVTNTSRIGL